MEKIFITRRPLRFGDCDISGTAYFPAYLDMLNSVNEEFWAHLGYAWHDIIGKERWGTPTVHPNHRYLGMYSPLSSLSSGWVGHQ